MGLEIAKILGIDNKDINTIGKKNENPGQSGLGSLDLLLSPPVLEFFLLNFFIFSSSKLDFFL